MSESAPDTTACKICREPIKAGAIKCIRCGSYQQWYRQFIASGSSMWLIVALLGATSAWWAPAVKEWLAPTGAVFKTAFGGAYGSSLGVSVTNVGTMPGAVQRLAFNIGTDKELTTYPLYIDAKSLIVEPGKTLLVTGSFLDGAVPEQSALLSLTQKCAIETWLTKDNSEMTAHRDWFQCIFALNAINEARGASTKKR
jgi:hypothetical protein